MIDLGFAQANLYLALELRLTWESSDRGREISTGTGFVATTAHEVPKAYLVTNRHVADYRMVTQGLNPKFLSVQATGWNFDAAADASSRVQFEVATEPIFSSDDEIDLALFPLEQARPLIPRAIELFVQPDIVATREEFADGRLRTGDFVVAPGYMALPGVAAGHRPTLILGVVASDPRFPLVVERRRSEGEASLAKAILYQSISRPGMSGAPVFATQRGIELGPGLNGPAHRPLRFVGVNGGGFNERGDMPIGYSYFVPSPDLLDLMNSVEPSAD